MSSIHLVGNLAKRKRLDKMATLGYQENMLSNVFAKSYSISWQRIRYNSDLLNLTIINIEPTVIAFYRLEIDISEPIKVVKVVVYK